VTRFGTPGSRKVRTELNRELAADLRGGKLSEAACERRRRTAKKLNLGQHLDTARERRLAGKSWTAEQVALLGTQRDADLAKLFGRTEAAVSVRRTLLGISTFRDRRN
jgi:hypothetical protein